MDYINEISPAPRRVNASSLLNIHGWLAASVEHAAVPGTVYLVLADSEGKRFFIDTKRTQRPDFGAHFNKISLNSTGYASVADVSSLKGHHS